MPLLFSENYKIDNRRWFFPYAEQAYLIVLANTFNAEDFKLKVEDVSNGVYETQILDLYNYNLYVLCSTENSRAARFGRKVNNRPIEVFLTSK